VLGSIGLSAALAAIGSDGMKRRSKTGCPPDRPILSGVTAKRPGSSHIGGSNDEFVVNGQAGDTATARAANFEVGKVGGFQSCRTANVRAVADAEVGHRQMGIAAGSQSKQVPAACVRQRQVALGTLSAAEWLCECLIKAGRRWQERCFRGPGLFAARASFNGLCLFTNHAAASSKSSFCGASLGG